jgi:Holliday junction resolvase RusA-like endonuclease
MLFKVESNEIATLDKINLKYITTKIDKYNNEFVYYSIQNKDFDNVVKEIADDMRCPWFKGKDNYVLKVKSKYLTEEQKINGGAVINLKQYEYENKKGYYANKIEFK